MIDYLLDTNCLILHLRNQPRVVALLNEWGGKNMMYISVITRTEILTRMHAQEETRTLSLLNSLISLPVNTTIADQAGRFIFQYARQGVQLSMPDALIASTALKYNLSLATSNARHFPFPDLQIYDLLQR
jgi:tRNA(fMet)-specific endonuclease VapC